jgi:uncharacterized protein YcbK (DUF882 family)
MAKMNLSPHFKRAELACKCCGRLPYESGVLPEGDYHLRFISPLEELRKAAGFPFVVSSAYRCPLHNARVGGSKASRHMDGTAVDVQVYGERAFHLVRLASHLDWGGIGVAQRSSTPPDSRYIHIDRRGSPALWSY